ncbi:polyketide synthase [Blastomyces dermatitidis ATCC 18188]|uniref:Polyketide synthase n=1 Tax=Ajellomyces dermatitidis (strain ATCC 18188 / CBS 674.68) TaxID=653446 RepID=F2TBP2_AJEDA|nr:polyketide synthase [Blastomyces dermatitidis ATCC 18188]
MGVIARVEYMDLELCGRHDTARGLKVFGLRRSWLVFAILGVKNIPDDNLCEKLKRKFDNYITWIFSSLAIYIIFDSYCVGSSNTIYRPKWFCEIKYRPLEGTSRLTGLGKAKLALERGIVSPSANFERLNPKIDADYLNIAHSTVEKPPLPEDIARRWKASLSHCYNSATKLGGVSGFSGGSEDPDGGLADGLETNESIYPRLQPRLLVWSSSDKEGISRIALSYSQYLHQLSLEQGKKSYLDNVAYTLGTRRSLVPWKSFVVADSLRNISLETSMSKPRLSTPKSYLGFVFSGQGSQLYAMGRELLYYPVFKRSLQDANEYLRNIGCPWSLLNEFLKPEDESRVNEPEYSQGLCTALQIALIDPLASFGIIPSVVVGHSSGEIAAAYTVHFISRRSAWKLAYYHGVLSSTSSRDTHTMMSVGLSAVQLSPYFEKVAANSRMMAIEAAKQIADPNCTVTGYNVRDVVFQAELNIPTSSDRIETRFYMKSIRSSPMRQFLLKTLDFNKPIQDFGADSLVAAELRNSFSRDWGTEVAVSDIIGGATFKMTGAW